MTHPESRDPVSDALDGVVRRHRDLTSGEIADYIPELATADPDQFGIAVTSVHGRVHTAGDAAAEFTIQSSSKPFVLALAVAESGLDRVAEHVDFEPSGEPFNAISLDPDSGRPANPMINAGAIVIAGLVAGRTVAERFERVRSTLSAFAGRELDVDERVYRSEDRTGDRNRALAHLARSARVLEASVEDAVEVYFRQCSLLVTARDLSVMAATLANAGVNPVTGVHVVDEQVARLTMSVMASCGMYDGSGDWMVRVGLPAKSGVGGGIIATAPGQFGIGVFSPPLDPQGNSVRGVAALRTLSQEYGLHLLTHPSTRRSPIVTSQDREEHHVITLRGELDFISAEELVGHLLEITDGDDGPRRVVLDLTGVTRVRPPAERLLAATASTLSAAGIELSALDTSGVVEGHGGDDGTELPTVRELRS